MKKLNFLEFHSGLKKNWDMIIERKNMKRDEEITQLVQNLSIDDCVELFRDICMKDLEMTKQAVEMGYELLRIKINLFI